MSENNAGDLLERQDRGDVTVVRIKVPMLRSDSLTDDLFGQVGSLVEDAGRHHLVLDFAAVEFLASVALGKLVTLVRKAREARGRLVLCHVTSAVDRLLELSHLADIIPIYDDEGRAVQSFA